MPTSPSRFDRSALPPAEVFYRANVAKFRARGRRATGLCPFHKDRNPSLSMDLDRGLYHCFTCASSGDMISFVRQLHGLDFKAAAKHFGAWRDVEPSKSERRRLARAHRHREQQKQQVETVAEKIHKLRMKYRSQIHSLERGQRVASQCLKAASSARDIERCWHVLGHTLPQLRDAIAAYYLLSFATVGERVDFAMQPEQRASAIQAVLERGTVRDDDGVVMEVDFSCAQNSGDVQGVELTFP
jgi:hypothetical protein